MSSQLPFCVFTLQCLPSLIFALLSQSSSSCHAYTHLHTYTTQCHPTWSLAPSFCSSVVSFTPSLPLFQIWALSCLLNLLSLPLNDLSCGAVYFRWRGADGLGYTTRLCKIIAASSINFEHVMTGSFHPIVSAGLENQRYELNICCSLLLF